MKEVILIHPSRGRPEQAYKASELWVKRAKHSSRIKEIICLDTDDPEAKKYENYHERSMMVIHDNKGMVDAVNRGYGFLDENQIIITMYDDFEPPQDYDYYLELLLKDHSGHAVFVDCDSQNGLQTIQIACSNLFKRWGYVLYPEYYSMYSDNDFTTQATMEGIAIDARFAMHFTHKHPLITGVGEMDETYNRSNSNEHYKSGEKIYKKRLIKFEENRQKQENKGN